MVRRQESGEDWSNQISRGQELSASAGAGASASTSASRTNCVSERLVRRRLDYRCIVHCLFRRGFCSCRLGCLGRNDDCLGLGRSGSGGAHRVDVRVTDWAQCGQFSVDP